MKKAVTVLTIFAFSLTTSLRGDEIGPQAEFVEADVATDDQQEMPTPEEAPKQVGKASTDGASAARSSTWGKYALAAGAIAVGIAALILVHKDSGHHHHHHNH